MATIEATPIETQHRARESEFYRQRRQQDPFIVLDNSPANLGNLISISLNGLEASSREGLQGEAIEFNTDLAYRLFLNGDYSSSMKSATNGANRARQELERPGIAPANALKLRMKEMDLLTVLSMSQFMKTTAKNNPEASKAAEKALEATAKRVIDMGVYALNDAQSKHNSTSSDQERSDLRGNMFELLYATWHRLKIYEDEEYDKKIVLGATDFEDRARFDAPVEGSHNFDYMIISNNGDVEQLIQCKNFEDDKRYAPPIEKVIGQAFHRFLSDDPQQYLRAIARLAGNSPDTTEEQMQHSQELLDSLFMTGQASQAVGSRALVGANVS